MNNFLQDPAGDCIDLYMCNSNIPFKVDVNHSREYVEVKQGDRLFVDFGVSVKLPKGYSIRVYARSSTFKKYGMILTNGVGVVDNAYCGDGDIIRGLFYCTEDATIYRYDRLAQFEVVPVQPTIEFKYVESLGGENRGGYGSTGN